MWRYGYPNAVNYDDNELFCGGYAVQWEQNEGRCGMCGDAYHLNSPRPHEAGGSYAKGIITRFYSAGQVRHFLFGLAARTHPPNRNGRVACNERIDCVRPNHNRKWHALRDERHST